MPSAIVIGSIAKIYPGSLTLCLGLVEKLSLYTAVTGISILIAGKEDCPDQT
jgi:hypothetical protein